MLIDTLPHLRKVDHHRPWPRLLVSEEGWHAAREYLAAGRWTLLGLWGDGATVHMAILEHNSVAVLSYECEDGSFPSLSAAHPPASRMERAIRVLNGLDAKDAPDRRPWLDLGLWVVGQPLGAKSPTAKYPEYKFLPAEGEGLHEVAVGPVHASIIEPGHFRFTCNGEYIVRLEERLGWTHKGIESLMAGASLEHAAQLAGRTSGDSTVAYAWAFAQAVEAALQIQAPQRAIYLRALMAELERLANHFGDIGAICNDASFAIMHTHCSILRERTLRVADACFGHRLMMDLIVPGGVLRDLSPDSIVNIHALLKEARHRFPRLVELYDNTASLQDRTVTTGVVRGELARQYGAGGYIGRASGRHFDARGSLPYAPYDKLSFVVPVLDMGDVNARVWVRIREVEQSLLLIEQIVSRLPDGPIQSPVTTIGDVCEGLGFAEAFRGEVMVWLRLDEAGHIDRCHLRDASWFQWPLLETAMEGNIIADFPLCNKSFNCSYSGHDL
jgi:Ni,Fe-hydrogenase III large subunit